ncbi:retrovirus-related pol polyprotein from transposon TNT 1-94 [Tanacetum coccineum]
MNASDPSPSCRPTKVDVPKELPKVSMVNTSLKKLKHHLVGFDVVVKERTTATTITQGSWGFEHTKACFRDEIIPFAKALKDIFNTFNQYVIDELSKVQNLFHQMEQVMEQHHIMNIFMNSTMDNASVNVHEYEKCLKLETELLNKKDFIEKETYDKLFKSFTTLEKYCISLEVDTQRKDLADNVVTKHTIAPEMLKIDVEPIAPRLLNNRTTHSYYLRHTQEQAAILREVVEQGKLLNPLNNSFESACKYTKRIQELLIIIRQTCPSINNSSDKLVVVIPKNKDKKVRFTEPITSSRNTNTNTTSSSNLVSNKPMLSSTGVKPSTSTSGSQPSGNTKKDKIQQTPSSTQKNKVESYSRTIKSSLKNKNYVLEPKGTANVQHSKLNANYELLCVKITITAEVPLRKPTALESDTPKPVVTLVYSRKPRKSKTNVPVSKPKIIKSTSANKKEPILLRDMMVSSPICLLSKASKTKSWLWNQRLSHLNFNAINHLARHGLVRGLPKLKFEKDHLCSACTMGKSKKKPHKPKSKDTNQEKLYLLHMDLCGPMRVASVNGKKYILVIVDDYSRFTWVKCLRSKDEAPDFIIKFLKMIQVRLKVPVRRIRTDNGTEFVNQTLREYYEKVDISHETSVARSPQQNGVVERRNRTLIEAARTMLIYAKAPLFLWAEAVATACYTQKSSPEYHTLRYTNLGKLQPKADIGIFIGYAPTKKAFRIYNQCTKRIIKTIHVDFDELTAMAFEHSSLEPALHEMTPATSVRTYVPNSLHSQQFIAPIAEVVAPEPAASTGSPSSTTINQDEPSPSDSQTTPETQSPVISNDTEEENYDLDVAHMNNDPFFGIPIPENNSEASFSSNVIPTIVQNVAPNSEHVTKWTKDHPLDNIIGKIDRPVSTRLQLHEQDLFSMQKELNEFERLEVWELVPCPDKVMVITLKWIYKVKLDELGEILKNKALLVACGYR